MTISQDTEPKTPQQTKKPFFSGASYGPNSKEDYATEANWKPMYTKILTMTHRGIGTDEISRQLDICTATVHRVRNSPYFIKKFSEITNKVLTKSVDRLVDNTVKDKVRDLLAKSAYRAAVKVRNIAHHGTKEDRVKLDACKDLLDRAGYKPKDVIETHDRVIHPEELVSALGTIQELELTVQRLENKNSDYVLPRDALGNLDHNGSSDTDKAPGLDDTTPTEKGEKGEPPEKGFPLEVSTNQTDSNASPFPDEPLDEAPSDHAHQQSQ